MKTVSQLTPAWRCALSDYITALAWAPDGDWLAVASAAGDVTLYTPSQQTITLQPAGRAAISTLAFAANGRFLAASGQAGQVTVWQVPAAQADSPTAIECPVVLAQDHAGVWIDQLAWHPQQNHLAYGVGTAITVWDITTSQSLGQLAFQTSSVLHLAWQPQGAWLAASGHGGVKVWSSHDWSAKPQLVAVPGASLHTAWSPDGRYLGSGNLDRTLTVTEWQSPPPWLMQGFPGKVRQIAWAPLAASASPLLAAACAEGITLWTPGRSPQAGWKSKVLQYHQDRVEAIAFQPGTAQLASIGRDGRIGLWSASGKLVQSLRADSGGLSALAWHPSGRFLATGSVAGQLTLWQPSTQGQGFGR